MPLPAFRLDELINGVFDGSISVFELPEWLYHYTAYNLDGSFFAGYGQVARGEILATDKAVNFRSNIGRFSGGKTFSEVEELTKSVFTADGKKASFASFKEKALKIDANYNVNWLRTEQQTVFTQAQNARKWAKFEQEKDIFPYLQYITVGDENVRKSHADLNGLIARVDDPIWNSIMPQNAFGCRCIVIQLSQAEVSSKQTIESKTRALRDDFSKSPEFDYNAGKTEYIFKESGKGKASYFKVPREFSDEQKNNFGFPSIEEATGVYI